MDVKEGWNPLALRIAPAREAQWVMQEAASGVEPATTVKSRVLVVVMVSGGVVDLFILQHEGAPLWAPRYIYSHFDGFDVPMLQGAVKLTPP